MNYYLEIKPLPTTSQELWRHQKQTLMMKAAVLGRSVAGLTVIRDGMFEREHTFAMGTFESAIKVFYVRDCLCLKLVTAEIGETATDHILTEPRIRTE